MSRTIELADEVYQRLEKAAAALRITPEEWIDRYLPPLPTPLLTRDGKVPKTLADLFEGRIGLIDSGSDENLSEDHSRIFGEILEEKRRRGTL